MHSSSTATTTKPKRYYDSVNQQLAENSQTVRGVIKQNKNPRSKDSEKPSLPQNRNIPLSKQQSNTSHASSSSSVNNDSFYDDDDALADYRMYPSCYNRQRIVVAPLGKTSGHDPQQKPIGPHSPAKETSHPK